MAITSHKVLVESDVFYALINMLDPKHPQTAACFRYFAQEKFQVFVSYPNLEDMYQDVSPSLAKDFLKGLILSSLNILYSTESELKTALKALINFQNSELTLKDVQTTVLANRNNINQICTFKYLHPLFGISSFNLQI